VGRLASVARTLAGVPPHASHVFDRHAADYDERLRRALIPPFDAFYGAAVAALDRLPAPPTSVLDLGAGTGLLSRKVAEAHSGVRLTLLDGSPAMLDRARAALGGRATYVVGDLADPLPDGPWSAIVSALAIHHLDHDAKRNLFARVHDALPPGGVFVNAEQVEAPTAAEQRENVEWHRTHALAGGADEDEWAAAVERMRVDRCATIDEQLAWLRDAGFETVDCPFEDHRFAVLVAARHA
jgi:tRNA (cmo5U34)-methyltransferase